MAILKDRKDKKRPEVHMQTAITERAYRSPFDRILKYTPLLEADAQLYLGLREAIPVIDAAISKIIRLIGQPKVVCQNRSTEDRLSAFLKNVPVGAGGKGIASFLSCHLDSLLTLGNAVGEIVLDDSGKIAGLYNAALQLLEIALDENRLLAEIYIKDGENTVKARNQDLLMFTPLNPFPAQITGNSILKSLPFVSSILIKIFNTTGINFERLGNLRFAVTYNPGSDQLSQDMAASRAAQIASEWSKAMNESYDGRVRDFVSVGDVQVKVIGADNQILDTQIPVRQMLEQIISKLGIPPFLLGIQWSTSERMSKQQVDMLTSELDFYRNLLNPIVEKIAYAWLATNGIADTVEVDWDCISLQDEVELAKARLYHAQAEQIEQQTKGGNPA